MSLLVDVQHQLGALKIDATFESNGRLTALFGPSGSGKTSIINMIAGLTKPSRGKIIVDGVSLFDSERRINVPAHKRRIGYVFQEARLFPHFSVQKNLDYGRWFAPRDAQISSDQLISLLGLGALLGRMPAKLSGGEKQRVAMARALFANPKILLMDEPLASLDQQRKNEIFPYIAKLRDELKIPIVYVSHSESEIRLLTSDIVMIENGRALATQTKITSGRKQLDNTLIA